jgi:hypothetical protein
MKSINEHATTIFFSLLERLGNEQYIKLTSEEFMPLHFEFIGEVVTNCGVSNAFSLMHSFLQNGDLTRDPEMCFLHFMDDPGNVFQGVFPYTYQLDAIGVYQEAISFRQFGHMDINPGLQEKLSQFANLWLANVKEQGFI